MARENAKKHVKSNASRLTLFRQISYALLALQVFVLWLSDRDGDLTTLSGLASFAVSVGFWFGQEMLSIKLLEKCSSPEYDASGDILDCVDLSDPQQLGVFSYAQDLLWVCWGVQFLSSVVSRYFLVLYLPVPAIAVYKGFTTFISPMLARRGGAGGAGEESADKTGHDDARSRLQRRREELRQRKGKKEKE